MKSFPDGLCKSTLQRPRSYWQDISQGQSAAPFMWGGQPLKVVERFKYLGSIFASDNTLDAPLSHRKVSASYAFQQLKRIGFWHNHCTLKMRESRLKACVLTRLLYSSETWGLRQDQSKQLDVFQRRCLRHILGMTLLNHVSNEDLHKQCGVKSITKEVSIRRLRVLGH